MMRLTLLAASIAAFPSAPPPATGATVVLVTELPAADARGAVLRRAQPRADVILLSQRGASAEDLAAALALLADARRRDGPAPPSRDALLVVKSSRLSRPLDERQRQRLEDHLARLRAAPPRPLDGFGTVPAIELEVRTRQR